ncbi:hypothetical protein H4R33_000838 [Dimargaris cristalligena]|uniref:Uncharacterized protein n=1 Tax=Dimargaris cristalligena TaxID=215637 RepID=A0A4P9ZUH3_9FUNG|nr:hypothetical protein H4R33_000838 [Dimargaris cristalligena]RKP36898.1 hypothetical protein BJ085DRAFT_28714 [Dimargaris cristalligena]|eukprot:RKP36898.1 hypothetical protein BJ085DRAFT_28714 [Dimargaris cristalligena]
MAATLGSASSSVTVALAELFLVSGLSPPTHLHEVWSSAEEPRDSTSTCPAPLEWFCGTITVLGTQSLDPAAPPGPTQFTVRSTWSLVGIPAQFPPQLHGCCVAPDQAPLFYDIVLRSIAKPTSGQIPVWVIRNVYRRPTGDLLELHSHATEISSVVFRSTDLSTTRTPQTERTAVFGTSPVNLLQGIRFEPRRLVTRATTGSHQAPWAAVRHQSVRALIRGLWLRTRESAVDQGEFDLWLNRAVVLCLGKCQWSTG